MIPTKVLFVLLRIHKHQLYKNGPAKGFINQNQLRYFNFEPSLKLRWCCARDLFGSKIPVTTGEFEMRIPCIQSIYLTHMAQWVRQLLHMQQIRSSNAPAVTGICDPNKSNARQINLMSLFFLSFSIVNELKAMA